MSEFNLPEVTWIDECKQVTTTQAMDAYLQPAVEQSEQLRTKHRDALTEAIVGEHTAKEVESGIWEHTFTPPQPRLLVPQIWADTLTRSLTTSFKYQRFMVFKEAHAELRRRNKRARRQHRAAFRRRKRGLA